MRTVQEESKRSIHSLRIDTVLGDPTPIKPRSVLPINPIDRPKVEDPEYLPDTVASLAACLSALARLVPTEKVQEIYRTIRDIIDRIAPVTQTSLDQLQTINESIKLADGRTRELTAVEKRAASKDLVSQIGSIISAINDKIYHYKSIGTKLAHIKAADLSDFIKRLISELKMLENIESRKTQLKSKDDLDKLEKLRLGVLEKLQTLFIEYTEIKKSEENTAEKRIFLEPSKTTLSIINRNLLLKQDHKSEILNAFQHRIVTLQAAGDSFDISVAQAVKTRKERVSKLLKENTTFTISIYREITQDSGDLSQFKVELTSRGKTDFDVHMDPLFFPGKIRAFQPNLTDEEEREGIEYNPMSSKAPFTKKAESNRESVSMQRIASSEYVQVYKRFLQMFDGTEVEILPDVRIDFYKIKEDFIDYATEDLKSQGIANPDEVAEKFYEQNKLFIIEDALNPDRGAVRFESPQTKRQFTKLKTPERAALVLANERIKDYAAQIEKAPQLAEEDVESYVKSEAAKQLSGGKTVEEVEDDLTSLSLRMREDEIRRIVNTAATTFNVKKEKDAEYNRVVANNIRKKVIAAFNKKAIVIPDTSPVPVGDVARLKQELLQIANSSFNMIATKSMSELAKSNIRNLQESEDFSPEAGKEADNKISEVSARAIKAAKTLDSNADQKIAIGIRNSLVSSITQICKRRSDSIQRVRSEIDSKESVSFVSKKYKNFNALAVASLKRLKEAPESIKPDTTLAEIAVIFASISRLILDVDRNRGNTSPDIRGILDDHIGHDVGRSINAAVENYRPASRFSATLNSGSATGPLVSHVSRIMSDLLSSEEIKDLLKINNVDFEKVKKIAYDRYGLMPTGLYFPVFLRAGAEEEIRSAMANAKINIRSPKIADTLFGSDGVGESIASAAEKAFSPNSVDVIIMLVNAAANSAIVDIKNEFSSKSPLPIVRAVVDIACIACIMSHESQSDNKEDEVQYFNAILDILRVGQTSPAILARHLLEPNMKETREISVDMSEIGTGFFVDIEGRPIARVVATPNPSDSHVSDVAFIDPALEEKFLEVEKQSSSMLIDSLNQAGNTREQNLIRQEVRNYLINVLVGVAARITNDKVIDPSDALKVFKIFAKSSGSSSDEATLKDKVEYWDTITRSIGYSPYSKSVAKAAINYHELTRKDPGNDVPYFTPVRKDQNVDPGSGEKVLKSGFDFVFRTLPLSPKSLEPSIEAMPQSLSDDFLKEVVDLVDLHVLTVIGDTFDEKLRKLTPPSKETSFRVKSKSSFNAKDKVPKSQKQNFDVHLTTMPVQAGEGSVKRSPSWLAKSQVLTVDTVISEGIPYSSEGQPSKISLLSLGEAAENFVIGMMLKSSGYLIPGAKSDDALKSLDKVRKNRTKVLNANANKIIDSVAKHVANQVVNATGMMTYTITDHTGKEKEVNLTKSDQESLSTKVSRGKMIKKLGAEYYGALQQAGPINLETDPLTGTPLMPPSPKTFFDEKTAGVREYRLTDPWLYVRRAVEVVNEYNKILESHGLIASSKSEHFADGIIELQRDFPYVIDRAQEISRTKMHDQKEPSFKTLQKIKIELAENDSITVNGTIPTTDFAIRLLTEINAAKDSLRSETASFNVVGREEVSAGIQRFDDKVAKLKQYQSRLPRNGEVTDTLIAFMEGYASAVASYEDLTASLEDLIRKELTSLADEVTQDGLSAAINETVIKLDAENKADSAKKLKSIFSRIFPRNTRSPEGEMLKMNSISSIAGTSIDELEKNFNLFSKNMNAAREKANQILRHVEQPIDRDIEIEAKKSASIVASKNNVSKSSIDPTPIIVDTASDLEALFTSLKNDKRKELEAVSKGRLAKASAKDISDIVEEIEEAATEFAKSALIGKIFGVRFLDSNKEVTS